MHPKYTGFIITLLVICSVNISALSLEGLPVTRYDPCGLAVLYFENVTHNVWQGVINVGMYRNMRQELEIGISFDKQVTLYEASQNSSFSVSNDSRDFTIKLKESTKRYMFHLSINGENTSDVPKINKLAVNNITLCNDLIKESQRGSDFNSHKEYDSTYHHICGRRSMEHAELTSVRTVANAGDWPWHTAVFIRDLLTNVDKYQCGASIISMTAVLSAAHCFSKNGVITNANRIRILAGVNNIKNLNHVGRQIFKADRVIFHPAFNDEQATSDLAIIRVNNIKFTEYVQPLCIWGPVYDKSKLFGMQATVVGFGAKEDNKLSDTLRSAYIMVQNDSTCIAYSPELYNDLLNEFTFCAGFGPTSSVNLRNGDSGSGLVVATVQPDLRISWFLRGVASKCGVSPGHTECDPKFYMVYTNVGPHYGWIYHNAGLEYRSNIGF